nr:MAG TPA: hypothetical protein [Caudoviricetes sp.]
MIIHLTNIIKSNIIKLGKQKECFTLKFLNDYVKNEKLSNIGNNDIR